MKHLFPSPLPKMPLATDATAGLFKRLRQTPPALWRRNENNAQQALRSSKGCVLLCIETEGLFSLSQQGKFRFYTWLKL